jgi:hypothetical protein
VGRGRPIDRSWWPAERQHRAFLQLLDKVHSDNGTKSLSDIAAAMNLRARSRVSVLLRGQALPADEDQVRDLIRALGGAVEDIERGMKLYRAARFSRQRADTPSRAYHALSAHMDSEAVEKGPAGEAVQRAQILVDQRTRDLGPDHPRTLDARQELAYCTGEDGSPTKAAALLRELARDRARVLGPDDPATLATRHTHAYWTGASGHPDEAARLLQLLVIDRARVLGPNHELTQKTRQNAIAWLSMTARCHAV